MNIVVVILCVALYILFGVMFTTLVCAGRIERAKQSETEPEPFADWAAGFAVMVWPLWVGLGVMIGLGAAVNRAARKGKE